MKHRIATAVAVSLLLAAPAVLAQSSATNPSHIPGSGQGGYLGSNPGPLIYPQQSSVPEARPAQSQAEQMMGWCRNSPEPSRCRARAATEHQICAGKASPETYGGCRHAMDQMHGQ
jgi:hypothetical protein